MKFFLLVSLYLASSISIKATEIPKELKKAIELFNEVTHNGGASVESKSPESLDFNKEIINIYAEGVKYGGCVDPKSISFKNNYVDKKEFSNDMIKNFTRDFAEYVEGMDINHLKEPVLATLKNLLLEEQTIAVVYSGFNIEGQDGYGAESCMYHTFKIFRADGLKLTLNFSYTD